MQIRKKKLSEFDKTLKVWQGKEGDWLRFYEIKREMKKQKWYERKVIRYLDDSARASII